MGIQPLRPPWRGRQPTAEEKAEYLAYLNRCLDQSRASFGPSLLVFAALAVFALVVVIASLLR